MASQLNRLISNAPLQEVLRNQLLIAWTQSQAYTLTTAVFDANEAIQGGTVLWPDGQTGTFTTLVASTAFPGAIDSYQITYLLNQVLHTVVQPLITRDSAGKITVQPLLVVTP